MKKIGTDTFFQHNAQKKVSVPIFFIIGPTAVGKSDVAFHLAQQQQGEIISCDSMQVYKEIHIASNKPSQEMQDQVPHHLIDIISVQEEFDVARYNQLALEAIQDIHNRGKVPIIVGGSGMYVQVLLDGIFEGGGKDEDFRQALVEQARMQGASFLYEELQKKDSISAEKIHPHDVKRIIRALEVYAQESKPISELQKKREGLWGKYDITIIGLNMDRQKLYQKIEARADQMFEEGLVEEIRQLQNVSLTVEGMIGVKEIRGFLNGDYDMDEAKTLLKRNTRRLAKRQLTWFRRDQRIRWLEIFPQGTAKIIAEKIILS